MHEVGDVSKGIAPVTVKFAGLDDEVDGGGAFAGF